jgi:tetratricopeptide (TPR) repeat protein
MGSVALIPRSGKDGVVGLFKKNPEKIEAKGDLCRDREEWVKAFTYYRDALGACREGQEEVRSRLADKVRKSKRVAFEKTAELANRLIREGERELAEGQLLTLRELAEDEAARAEIQRALDDIESGRAFVRSKVPEVEEDPEEHDESDVLFEQAVGILPEEDRERALGMNEAFRKGLLGYASGDYEEAAEKLEWAQNSYPDDAMILELRSHALLQLGRSAEAGKILRKLVEARPHRPDAWIALAGHEVQEGRPEGALEVLREGQGKNPLTGDSLELYLEEPQVLMALGRHGEALERIGAILDFGPDDATTASLLAARACELSGDADAASDYYDEALVPRCSCSPAVLTRIGLSHAQSPFDVGGDHFLLKGDHKRALDLYNIAENQVGPNPDRAAKIAVIYAATGETEAARRLVSRAGIPLDPSAPEEFLQQVRARHLGAA